MTNDKNEKLRAEFEASAELHEYVGNWDYKHGFHHGYQAAAKPRDELIEKLVDALGAREVFANTKFVNDKDARAALRGVIRKEKKALKAARAQGYGE